jgi:hypothetical protein
MGWPFQPTWKKAESCKPGFGQFDYLMDKDVRREWGRVGYAGLNPGRQLAVHFYWLMAELDNGGLVQYFWNSSGDFAEATITALKQIGQTRPAEILEQAAIRLLGRAERISDTGERRAMIVERLGTHPFNDDDDQERLALLSGKVNLEVETRDLRNLVIPMIIAVFGWMRSNPSYFDHIK